MSVIIFSLLHIDISYTIIFIIIDESLIIFYNYASKCVCVYLSFFISVSQSFSLSLSLSVAHSLFFSLGVSHSPSFSLSPSSSYLLYLHLLIHFLYFLFPPRVLTYYGLMLAGAVARSASATAGKLHYSSFFFLYLDIYHHLFIRSLPPQGPISPQSTFFTSFINLITYFIFW